MPIVPHLESIAAIAGQSGTAEHFSYGFRDFLDGFYENPHGSKLAEEPRRLTQILKDEGYADAYLAALAEHLAGQFRLPVPAWARNPERSLREPKFAFKTPEGGSFCWWRARRLFVSAIFSSPQTP